MQHLMIAKYKPDAIQWASLHMKVYLSESIPYPIVLLYMNIGLNI